MVMLYYDQSHHREQSRFRTQVMRALAERRHLKTSVGFVSRNPLPRDAADLKHPRLDMWTYLEQLARSKVAIYVRGPHDGISSKFGQLMALGKPIVGQSLANNRERLYGFPSIERQFAFDEPEALVARVDDLLQQPEELDRLARSNATIFDRYLNPKAIVTELLSFLDGALVCTDPGQVRKDVNVEFATNA
jgi:hypothetical protein